MLNKSGQKYREGLLKVVTLILVFKSQLGSNLNQDTDSDSSVVQVIQAECKMTMLTNITILFNPFLGLTLEF